VPVLGPAPGPEPSKLRAAASFATGFALFGTGGIGGLARDGGVAAKPSPEQKRRVMWGGLFMYALAIAGGFIGAGLARHTAVGVVVGVVAGFVVAGPLLLVWVGAAALMHRIRS